MGSYEDERHWPKHVGAIRSHLRLTFNGGSLKLPGHGRSYPAVSGRHEIGGFAYSKDRQKLAFEGPIPEGVYWVAPAELWTDFSFMGAAFPAALVASIFGRIWTGSLATLRKSLAAIRTFIASLLSTTISSIENDALCTRFIGSRGPFSGRLRQCGRLHRML